jgi:hypothetical protein
MSTVSWYIGKADIYFRTEGSVPFWSRSGRKPVGDVIREQRYRDTSIFLKSHLLGKIERSCGPLPSSSVKVF